MMAKTYPEVRNKNMPKMSVKKVLFLDVRKDESGKVTQVSVINMLSPIKCEVIYNKYASNGKDKISSMDRVDKFMTESDLDVDDLMKDVNNMLCNDMNKDKEIWSFGDVDFIKRDINSIKTKYDMENEDKIVEFLKYKKNPEKHYSLNMTDTLSRNILMVSFMFLNNFFN